MSLTLIICALLPAIVLCSYVFIKDRVEKEPLGLLLLLLLAGVLSCIPAIVLESFFEEIGSAFFAPFAIPTEDGGFTFAGIYFYLYQFFKAFVVAGFSEELVKWCFLKGITFKNKNFNCLFDGLIYAVFVSLGFAALENILYVFQYGFTTAISRAVLSVPAHMFFSVIMGYHYSKWHILKEVNNIEKSLKIQGKIPYNAIETDYKKNAIFSLLLPVIIHGFYDFCLFVGSLSAFMIFIVFMIFMYIFCFARIKKFSKSDTHEYNYVVRILLRKYPSLTIDDIF